MKSKKKSYLKKGNIIKRNFKKGDTVKSSNVNELCYNFTGFFCRFDNINISEISVSKIKYFEFESYNIKSKSPLYKFLRVKPNGYISTRMVLTEKRINVNMGKF